MAPFLRLLEYAAVLAVFLSSPGSVSGGKILVVTMEGSHWLSMLPVLNRLKQNGHEIEVVAPEESLYIKASDDIYTLKTYPVPFTKEEMGEALQAFTQASFEELPILARFARTIERVREMSALFLSGCTHLLYNKELMRHIERSEFDALFADPMMPCGQIVADHLGIPSVFFLHGLPCNLHATAAQCPRPPSYIPRRATGNTDRMTFAGRVKNVMSYLAESFICNFVYSPYADLASEFLHKKMTITELLSHGSVWLMKIDFVNDYPGPLMPNMIPVGGINCAGRKRLAQVCNGIYMKS